MTENHFRGNQLHRLAKLLMDTGEAATVEEANRILARYRLGIQVGKGAIRSPALQASLLTAVNTGRRCFLGGVQVTGDLEVPLQIPWRQCSTLAEAVSDLQGQIAGELNPGLPMIYFGDGTPNDECSRFAVRPVIRGWSGGVVPFNDLVDVPGAESFTPAGVLAGALAVSEAFQFIRGDNPQAGHRPIGLSLWRPEQSKTWLDADPGPMITSLPAKLWLIGLGHLGQAYLWTLGFLPYPRPNSAKLVLQDIDELEDANDSTSLLTHRELVGTRKTRVMAAWSEERGFQTTLVERKFAGDFRIHDDEPALALCGVDNIDARADLEKVGFKRIIEAGLGKGTQEYLSFQIHTFPASRLAEKCWMRKTEEDETANRLIQQPAYQELHAKGMDRCGLTELAGRSVGASFVGAIASALVIAQVLRILRGENIDQVIDGDLRSSHILSSVIPNQTKLAPFNPGLIVV